LVVTTKGNGNAIDVFAIGPLGLPSARPTVTADPGNVPFAMVFDSRGHLVVAEAGPNAIATFTIHRNGTLSVLDREATGQAGTCWVATDGTRFYTSNAGSATLSGYLDTGSGRLEVLGRTATDPGTVDAAVSSNGNFLYAQTGANGVVDEYRIRADGTLTRIGSVTVPGSVGAEGIAAS
jgi:6-phosphogluconolactonase (cycloisomerase 2 family)